MRFYKLLIVFLLLSNCRVLLADDTTSIKRFSFKLEGAHIFPTNDFLRGNNLAHSPINKNVSAHLKYSFQSPRGTWQDAAFGSSYQGVGLSVNTFFNNKEVGRPISLYMFQGGRLLSLSPVLSLKYEWNLGLSWGWEPFNSITNPYNVVMGSRFNAYLASNFYLLYAVNNKVDISAGVGLAHYSNGNTTIPNEGINLITSNFELSYNFGRNYRDQTPALRPAKIEHHYLYELMVFSGWKRRGLDFPNISLKQKYMGKRFLIGGMSFAPLYVLSRKFRVGGSVDLSVDRSIATRYIIKSDVLYYQYPQLDRQFSLGLAGRFDYTMPYFTISTTLGYKFINYWTGIDAVYQTIAMKIDLTHNSFLNIGYSIVGFTKANFLMFGAGYLFR